MVGSTHPGLSISKLHHPVTVLGFGMRAGIWFQGCSIGCRGCISTDTWAFAEQDRVSVESVIDWLDGLAGGLDGVTISGGEPFDQPRALLDLLESLDRRRNDQFDVLVYSGHTFEWISDSCAEHLQLIDALISDPFVDRRDGAVPLRGSANQRLTCLTPIAEERYAGLDHALPAPAVQVEVADGKIWMIGIPQRGDIERFQQSLADRGIALRDVSWRP